MLLKTHAFLASASMLILGAATAARADVTISLDATTNMDCAAGICQPTASDAVLNVGDLRSLLASGNLTVTTTGSGVQANNIDISVKLGWSAHALTLDAFQSISISAPVAVKDTGALTILTNDGGSGGAFGFAGKGHVTFENIAARLTINGASYKLEDTIAALADAIRRDKTGSFALANDYDASQDGKYRISPIPVVFGGAFEGLGNRIENLVLVDRSDTFIGFFAMSTGSLSNIGIVNADVDLRHDSNKQAYTGVGILAGYSSGSITGSYVSGRVSAPKKSGAGGLAGQTYGLIAHSHADVVVKAHEGAGTYPSYAGGLVASSDSTIVDCWATGSVIGATAGGLVGAIYSGGTIDQSFASTRVTAGLYGGGLVGSSGQAGGGITNSYATGQVGGPNATGGLVGYNYGTISHGYSTGAVGTSTYQGGMIGEDVSGSGSLGDTYWDTDMSGVTDPAQGAGNIANDPGITGLSTEELQSGLPAGFDPAIWGENAGINNGMPYLLANPPR